MVLIGDPLPQIRFDAFDESLDLRFEVGSLSKTRHVPPMGPV
jgi:hypothetical protein